MPVMNLNIETDDIIEAMIDDPTFQTTLMRQTLCCMSEGLMLDDLCDSLHTAQEDELQAIYKVISLLHQRVSEDLKALADM